MPRRRGEHVLLHPADFGVAEGGAGGAARRRCRRQRGIVARDVLAGERGAPRDIVLLNAAASLLIAGAAADHRARACSWRPRRSTAAERRPCSTRLVRASQRGAGGAPYRDCSADLLATIVAATRRIVAGARGARPARRALEQRITRRRGRTGEFARRAAAIRSAPRGRSPSASGGRRRRASCARATTRPRTRARTRDAGAAAISVLTEPTFFDGALEHLARRPGGGRAPAAAQGLHRVGVPAARSGGARRGRRAADRRRARRCSRWRG